MHVTLYTKAGNPYCDMIRNLLQYHNVSFEVVPVDVNPAAQQQLLEVSGQPDVPVLVIDGKAFVGFDREKIKEFLRLGLKTEEAGLPPPTAADPAAVAHEPEHALIPW